LPLPALPSLAMPVLALALLAMPVLALPWLAAPAAAAETENQSVYRLDWRREIPIMALSGGAALYLRGRKEIGRDPCPCDPAEINSFDRPHAGRESEGAAVASDAVLALTFVVPMVADIIDVRGAPDAGDALAEDAVVILEAVGVNLAVNELVRVMVSRPRPFLYGRPAGDPAHQEAESYRSFYSAHASIAFSSAIAYARTFALRHPDSPSRPWVYGAAVLGAGAVASLRVVAGKHFPTDVILGAAAGSAFGLLLPELHRRDRNDGLSLQSSGDGFMAVISFPLP
jgi:membrane-associated phospholipid phosphatase